MAEKNGVIKQFKGPFAVNQQLNIGNGNCKIGISISEDDFMKLGSEQHTSFQFIINDQLIHMGRSYMYETDSQINNTTISFPKGAPLSTIVDIVYCQRLT